MENKMFVPHSISGGELEPKIEISYENGVIFLLQGEHLVSINKECMTDFIALVSELEREVDKANGEFMQEYESTGNKK